MKKCCKPLAGIISDGHKMYNYFFTFQVVNDGNYFFRVLILLHMKEQANKIRTKIQRK